MITMNDRSLITRSAAIALALVGALHAEDAAWWNPAWTQRQALTLDTGSNAAALGEDVAGATVLLRLSESNFHFSAAREDGSDLRIVAADGKTLLPYQIERYDSLLNEAFIWVKLPAVKAAAKETLYIYFGNADAAMPAAGKPSDAFDADTALVYHFGGRASAPADATANNNTASTVATTADGSLIGGGLRLPGTAPVAIPNSASLEWQANQPLTVTTWLKPGAPQDNAVILSRADGKASLRLLLDKGVPVIQLNDARSQPGAPLAAGTWNHLALVADGKTIRLLLNGAPYASLDGGLPALATPLVIGRLTTTSADTSALAGELDEFAVARVARSAGWIKLAAVNQGTSDAGQRTLSLGALEGAGVKPQSKVMEHLSLFGDIAGNMMFDGWISVGICAIMIVIGWTVAVRKFLYLNSIEKGTRVFIQQWKNLSTDLTALNPDDSSNVSSLGGQVEPAQQGLLEKSPLFHIYQIGSEEIRHRLDKNRSRHQVLSSRSIQAIRASLDAGLVHESHRLSDGLVYLTISIAGGPYVGLLGTVVGVMITFAIIARSGEVNVNSIAPGIASALLATVVGLVVAIPALFIYSYLNGRIKNSLALMQVFIDEFVAKMAEFYRPALESEQHTDSP